MPKPGLDKVDRIYEKDVAVLEGMDISGHWNRMFEQRVVWDYSTDVLERITGLPGGESLGWCYQCGKCVPVCPVDVVGDYGPRKVYRKAQLGIDLLRDPDLWLCTTCMNCLRVCPKEVNMIEIMPAAREVAVQEGRVPPELQKVFENTARYGNPMGESPRKRAEWVKEAGVPVTVLPLDPRPVDVLWYVGSYPSYHPRGKDAARAMARVFHALGVDYGILGHEEKEDGDSIRLAGEKGLFEVLAEANIRTFRKYTFNRIVVTGPHEYNAFKNFYPRYGGSFDVLHYTQFLAPFLPRLREMFVKELPYTVTFHDPCYLGRHHGEYDAPRRLLQAIPGLRLVEMPRCRENGYCCGGGGGGMWLDGFSRDYLRERLSDRRVREAVETGAEILAVCCPYEVSRFEDSVKATGNDGKLVVRDIIELLDEALGSPRAT
ncbi:MAG: (Fe-S)-binding protein [Armatimonadota bacterium]|nr:(Fe-S)-binding protein [Armatimonadota bacterium]MDR5688890.1 (Fe-S)-binding protein [Armatimonadota bacterium]MDR7387191.1 (Fe-S)-binding protein [Armatimonadota bacterium]MDR7390002.1 (Fe-S)-binding protein [Armatimonadota bacterium]MDR7392725.1 (Fe-S)-binding protein [Armatimonadota bacterium]